MGPGARRVLGAGPRYDHLAVARTMAAARYRAAVGHDETVGRAGDHLDGAGGAGDGAAIPAGDPAPGRADDRAECRSRAAAVRARPAAGRLQAGLHRPVLTNARLPVRP